MIAAVLGLCAAGSIPLPINAIVIDQPLGVADDLAVAESANPQYPYTIGHHGGHGGYGGKCRSAAI